jgi:hypothetical protein
LGLTTNHAIRSHGHRYGVTVKDAGMSAIDHADVSFIAEQHGKCIVAVESAKVGVRRL